MRMQQSASFKREARQSLLHGGVMTSFTVDVHANSLPVVEKLLSCSMKVKFLKRIFIYLFRKKVLLEYVIYDMTNETASDSMQI